MKTYILSIFILFNITLLFTLSCDCSEQYIKYKDNYIRVPSSSHTRMNLVQNSENDNNTKNNKINKIKYVNPNNNKKRFLLLMILMN